MLPPSGNVDGVYAEIAPCHHPAPSAAGEHAGQRKAAFDGLFAPVQHGVVALHQLRSQQAVPLSLDEAWGFFSDPRNLAVITPPDMGFVIHSEVPDDMYPGLLIEYTLRPMLNIPVRWVTEITHVADREYFVDVQRSGPYAFWQHEHRFRAIEGGVEVRDLVSYRLPLGPLGDVVNQVVVRRRLAGIFEYRRRVLEDRFGVVG